MSLLTKFLLFGVTSFNPTEFVDLIELNHVFDCRGNHCFSQVIYWERDAATSRLEVRAWRMVADNELHTRRPVKSEISGLWVSEWTEANKRYRIVARQYHESWTPTDREMDARKKLPDDQRKGLFSGPVKRAEE